MNEKVVHLSFKEPKDKPDLYFGSLKAIYDVVPLEEVGITYKALTNAIRGKERYENKKCVILIGKIVRKAHSSETINQDDQ